MKFKNLTSEQRSQLRHIFTGCESKGAAYDTATGLFKVNERTIRKWISKMGLTRKYTLRPDNISVVDAKVIQPGQPKSPAKILIYDIETSPMSAYVWGTWQQNIGHNMGMLQQDWFILTWSAKWLFEDKVHSARLTPEEVKNEDNTRIINQLWQLFNEADVIIAHNGKKFDNKRVNTIFLKYGLPQPMPYQVIDTLEVARKNFSLSSNKLDYIGQVLGVGRKVDTGGFDLWNRCMKGEEQALIDMETYNIQDVILLEEIYLKLRPYVKPHPNMGLYITEDVKACPSCGSSDLERGGKYATSMNLYEAFRCSNCGSIGRSRQSSIPLNNRKNLLNPAAR